MDRLERKFEDRVDFFHLDIDSRGTRDVRQEFDLRSHTHYVLIDAEGNVLGRWFGYLNEETITADIEEALAILEVQTNELGPE